jgi:mannose-6-phosphate isomerase-like protein (cupin superfamily)
MGVSSRRRADISAINTPVHELRVYVDDAALPTLSITEIHRLQPYDWSESKDKTFFYYILEGQGDFHLNDDVLSLAQGDLFVVPQNARYRTPVGIKLLAITTPRFSS